MAVKRKKSNKRKPFWERMLELFLATMKRMLIPALAIWLIGWLWLGGVFTATKNMAWDGFVGWTASQGLVVDDVVIDGRGRTDLMALKSVINTQINAPILSVDVSQIQNEIAGLPWVSEVIVSRNFNGIVHVQMVERIPFVLWIRPGRGAVVVDTKGHVIAGANPSEFSKLLNVRGVDAPQYTVELMQNVLAEPNVVKHIRAAEWIGDRRWDIITVKGTRIYLPEDDMGYALSRLAKIQDEKNILRQDLKSIDLRASDRVIIESERGKSQDLMSLSSDIKESSI